MVWIVWAFPKLLIISFSSPVLLPWPKFLVVGMLGKRWLTLSSASGAELAPRQEDQVWAHI
jgi:hypothetical protein